MRVCVVNAGSSSLKLQWLDMQDERLLLKAMVDRLGTAAARLRVIAGSGREEAATGLDMAGSIGRLTDLALDEGLPRPDLCVHRVVHGGDRFAMPVIIDAAILSELQQLCTLAPLHMPANLAGIEACQARFPDIPHVAVFDTAFHATLGPEAYRYAIPQTWHALGVRRYGFHGSSHQYVMGRWAEWQRRDTGSLNLITVHLGNGSSLCAIREGRSVDTTMGLTPLEGMIMGTRCGDLDPGIPGMMARLAGLSINEVDHALWHESGLKGLCGSSDMRDILGRADRGDASACLARDVYCHALKRQLGAMMAVAGGQPQAIILTGGIGEHAAALRLQALEGLEHLGIRLCPQRNAAAADGDRLISREDSAVAVAVIPTNEELHMAREAVRSVQRST